MRLELSMSDLPQLKADLLKYHPDVAASHRIEGAARGFGFTTYAGMREALGKGTLSLEPYDRVFADYIGYTSYKDREGPRTLSRSLARIAVKRVLDMEASLTGRGFDGAYPQSPNERKMSPQERRAAFNQRREDALSDWDMDQFELALIYLDMQDRRKTINMDFSSYGLKHRAENLSRSQNLHTHLGNYVSNGMFIVAAIARGFQYKVTHLGSPNACFNISSKTIRATAEGPIATRREKTEALAWALAAIRSQEPEGAEA